MRLTHRAVVVVATVVVALIATLAPAKAAFGVDLCKDAPPPIGPQDGMAGMVTIRPAKIPEIAPDPFANPSVPIGDVYGYNWSWANYDLGCGNDFLSDPAAVASTLQANNTMGVSSVFLAELDTLEFLARDAGIPWMTDIVAAVADPLRDLLINGFTRNGLRIPGWIPIAVLATGVVIVFNARRAKLAQTAKIALVVAVCLVLSVGLLYLPTAASQQADKLVVSVSQRAGTGLNTSLSDGPNRHGAYRVWLTGWFGSADSALAKQYGPALMAATHYSWSDIQTIERDPGQRERIDAAKADSFKQIAQAVKDRDPGAYERFKGKGGNRIGIALMGLFTVICMDLFALIACVMILLGRVIMQALVVGAPIGAAIGILPGQGHMLRRMWDLFTAALVGVAKYVIAAGVMALVLSALARLDPVTAPVWMIIATITALVLTKPARTFKTMVPGLDPNRSYAREGLGLLVSAATMANAMPDRPPTPAVNAPDTARPASKAKTTTSTPAPRADHVTVLTKPTPHLEPGQTTATPKSLGREPHRELPAAPDRTPATVPVAPVSPGPRSIASQQSVTGDRLPALRRPATVVPSSPSETADVETVRPTGVIVQTPPKPGTLPQHNGTIATRVQAAEEYVRLPEPEMDTSGQSRDIVLYVPRNRQVVPA